MTEDSTNIALAVLQKRFAFTPLLTRTLKNVLSFSLF